MDNVLTGTIGFDKVPDFSSVQEQQANKPTKFKLGMRGTIAVVINGFKFATNGIHEGKVVGLRGADSYAPDGQFTSGQTHVLDCELKVVNWGKPQALHIDPVTKEHYYPVLYTEAILTYRVGTCGGAEAYAKTVWDAAMSGILTLTKATWGQGDHFLWSLEGAVKTPVAAPAEKAVSLETRVDSIEARLTKAGL